MNESYFQSVIDDREREVSKYVQYNQTHRNLGNSISSQRDSVEQGKNGLILRLLVVAKRLKSYFAITAEDHVKV